MSEPSQLNELLEGLLADLGVARPIDTAELVDRWDDLAGEPFAGRSRPVHLDDGALVVEVADGATATLLRYHEAELIGRLGAELGQGLVSSIRTRVRRSQHGPT